MLLPDSGRGYLAKVFNDEWLARYGFAVVAERAHRRRRPRGEVASRCPSFLHTHPNETVRDAIDILREYGVSQLPVVKAEPPVMAAEVVGSVTERALLDALFSGDAPLADAVERHMSPRAPDRGLGRADRGGARVAEGRRRRSSCSPTASPIGVLTRQDLLGHLVR